MTKKSKKKSENEYTAESIKVLDVISHVRLRPSMYVGSDGEEGYYHIAKEVVDNALDECLAGHADYVAITLDKDKKGMTVADNGRGVPHEKHPKTKKSTLVTVFSTANTGGKFDGKTYGTSVGLHGIGTKATNALSELFEAWSYRGGKVAYAKFNYGRLSGMTDAEIKKAKKSDGTGTIIHFRPDHGKFKGVNGFDPKVLRARYEEVTHLATGITISFEGKEYHSDEGLYGLLKSRLAKKASFQVDPFEVKNLAVDVEVEGEGKAKAMVDVAVSWTGDMSELGEWLTYVNLTPTEEGGTHLSGLDKAMAETLLAMAKNKCTTQELYRGMKAAIHIRHPGPKFKSQTKNRLVNQDVTAAVHEALAPHFAKWAKKNREWLNAHIALAIQVYEEKAMSKELRDAMRDMKKVTKNSRGLLPGKLSEADCDPSVRELFIVEGDSASGTLKAARDSSYQEVLPLRGKVLNAMRTDLAKALSNNELRDIVTAIGGGVGPTFDLSKCRVAKVLLMSDADVDGAHITALLLGFMVQYMAPLIEDGRVYLVDSPLFQGSIPTSKKRYYGHTVGDLRTKAGPDFARLEITRLKGHGEANADAIYDYAVNPDTRKLIRVTADSKTLQEISALMSNDVTARKKILGLS